MLKTEVHHHGNQQERHRKYCTQNFDHIWGLAVQLKNSRFEFLIYAVGLYRNIKELYAQHDLTEVDINTLWLEGGEGDHAHALPLFLLSKMEGVHVI